MQFKGLLYYSAVIIRYSLLIFWLILMGVLLLSIGAQMIFGAEGTNIYFSFSASIYVYAGIMGYYMVKQIIPYLIKMGSDRWNIYVGCSIVFLFISLFNALMSNIVTSTVTKIYDSINISVIQFNHIANLLEDTSWFSQVMIDTIISLFFLVVSFVIGLVFYRYNMLGGFSFLGLILFLNIIAASLGWTESFVRYVVQHFDLVLFYQLFGVGVIVYLFTYLLLRRITIQ